MKAVLASCFWWLGGLWALAQDPSSREYFLREVKVPNYDAKIEVNQWGDTVFVNYYKSQDPLNKTYNEFTKTFKGTPFFKNGWYKGQVISEDGFPTSFQMAFNLQKNELYLISSLAREVVTMRPKTFVIEGHIFRQEQNRFFENVYLGKTTLLKEYSCRLELFQSYQKTSYDAQSNAQGYEGEFVKTAKYYVKEGEKLKEVVTRKKLSKHFGEKQKAVELFIKTNNLNPKKEADLVAVFRHYDSLSK
ncbi:MAG: hypothetical protein MUE30_02185 [Spirosomaceae bacterium]|nr:hypothetical protein [Spirosomataceae bacterium]